MTASNVTRIVICCYCGDRAKLVTGAELYGAARCRPEFEKNWYWSCRPCKAYVGTHRNSPDFAPMGIIADQARRHARQSAHEAFDPIFKSGLLARRAAYDWLARMMGMPVERCHIAMFNEEQCTEVLRVCANMHDAFSRWFVEYTHAAECAVVRAME